MPLLPNQFKNMNDLVEVLNTLDKRVQDLEVENQQLRQKAEEGFNRSTDTIEFLRDNWPKTNLLSKNFLMRGLSVYGYFLLFNTVISIVLALLSFLFLAPVISNMLQTLSNGVPVR